MKLLILPDKLQKKTQNSLERLWLHWHQEGSKQNVSLVFMRCGKPCWKEKITTVTVFHWSMDVFVQLQQKQPCYNVDCFDDILAAANIASC